MLAQRRDLLLSLAQLIGGAEGVGLVLRDLVFQPLQLFAQAAFDFPRGQLLLVKLAPVFLQFLIESGDSAQGFP